MGCDVTTVLAWDVYGMGCYHCLSMGCVWNGMLPQSEHGMCMGCDVTTVLAWDVYGMGCYHSLNM